MKQVLMVGGLVAAAGLGVALMSGALCGGSCELASTPAPALQTVAMTPQAAVAAATPALVLANVSEGAYEVDNVHSSVLFSVKHNNVSNFYGRFNEVKGSFRIDKADPTKSMLDISVDADKVDSNNEGRDKHLRGPDFFSTKEFPAITFKSKSFTKKSDTSYDVTGDLTLRGVTKPVTIALEHTGEGEGRRGGKVAGFEAKFTIKRSDFGVSYMVGPGLADDVSLIVSLQGAMK